MNKKTLAPTVMSKPVQDLVDQIALVLSQMSTGQDKLLEIIKSKHEAMRKSNVQAMLVASANEGVLANALLDLDKHRRDLSLQLSSLLKVGTPGLQVTLRALATRLPADVGARLLTVAGELRQRMLKVAEANRVVELVCQRMLANFKAIFSAMSQAADAPPTYSSAGQRSQSTEAMVLDAVA